jgi:hypothetical protein
MEAHGQNAFRVASSQRITRATSRASDPVIRNLFFRSAIPMPAVNVISTTLFGFVESPFTMVYMLLRADYSPVQKAFCDILFSNDAALDDAAVLRDQRASGLTGPSTGFILSRNAVPQKITHHVAGGHKFIKLYMICTGAPSASTWVTIQIAVH